MVAEPSFLELGVADGQRARDFYARLFGWSFDDMGAGNFFAPTRPVDTGVHRGDERNAFVVYFSVDDIEAAARRVRELGGECGEPGPETKGFGRFVECKDDQGVLFGLRQLPR
jgi:predicted enzyme related to lactoylglutathione lyase